MAKLQYRAKSQEYGADGVATFTKVTLGNDEGAIVPVFLPANVIDESNEELYRLAMEKHYQDNFPAKAETEKFNKFDEKIEANKETVARLETLAYTLVLLAVSGKDNLPLDVYNKVAELLPELETGKRYGKGDIVQIPYPYTNNPKYAQDSPTILRFLADWTHKGQALSEMLAKGAVATVMPQLG